MASRILIGCCSATSSSENDRTVSRNSIADAGIVGNLAGAPATVGESGPVHGGRIFVDDHRVPRSAPLSPFPIRECELRRGSRQLVSGVGEPAQAGPVPDDEHHESPRTATRAPNHWMLDEAPSVPPPPTALRRVRARLTPRRPPRQGANGQSTSASARRPARSRWIGRTRPYSCRTRSGLPTMPGCST